MNENTYVEKFQKKTDAELRYILENKKKYNEEAVFASIQILRDRNPSSTDLEKISDDIKAGQERKMAAQRRIVEDKKKKNNLTDDPNAPELHSKKVIRVFAILFSTIFGAVLLMFNMKETDNSKGRIQVLVFGILYTLASIVLINLLNIKSNFLALFFNLAGGAILTEYFWDKFIGKEFKYRKRSWVKPAIISIIILVPFLLAAIYGG